MSPRERSHPERAPLWSLQPVPAPDRGVVILAAGEFDIAAVSDVQQAISDAAGAQPTRPRVVIDLSRVTFLDAAMLNVLVAERQALLRAQGDLIVTGVSNWSMRIITICGLRKTLGL